MFTEIGHYKVDSELGRGGMGVVYKAHEAALDRYVAIKMLANQVAGDQQMVARFQREARSVAALNHPNVTQIYFIGQEKGQPYFVMEFVDGETLSRLIRRELRLPTDLAARILLQAASGLEAAHRRGIIHRDIKPANIMISKQGLVKVTDFGIARLQDPLQKLTATGEFLGTPGYLSPEVCLGEEMDHRSDIFSLGIVLYEMLTGITPFKNDSPLAMMREVVEAAIPNVRGLNDDVDDVLSAILDKMVAKKREQRYQSCREIISDLEAYLGTQNSSIWAERAPAKAAPPGKISLTNPYPGAVDDSATRATEVLSGSSTESPGIAAVPPVGQEQPPPLGAGPAEVLPLPQPGGFGPPTGAYEEATVRVPSAAPSDPGRRGSGKKWPWLAGLGLLAASLLVVLFLLNRGVDQPEPEPVAQKYEEMVPSPLDPPEATSSSETEDPFEEEPQPSDGELPDSQPVEIAVSDRVDDTATTEIDKTSPMSESGSDRAGNKTETFVELEPEGKVISGIPSNAAMTSKLTAEKTDFRPIETSPPPAKADSVSPMRGQPQIAVVVLGDPLLADPLEDVLKTYLLQDKHRLWQPSGPWDPNEDPHARVDLEALGHTLSGKGADLVVVAEIRFLSERELTYLGRSSVAYTAGVKFRCYDPRSEQLLGDGWKQRVEYTSLNAAAKARDAVLAVIQPLSTSLGDFKTSR